MSGSLLPCDTNPLHTLHPWMFRLLFLKLGCQTLISAISQCFLHSSIHRASIERGIISRNTLGIFIRDTYLYVREIKGTLFDDGCWCIISPSWPSNILSYVTFRKSTLLVELRASFCRLIVAVWCVFVMVTHPYSRRRQNFVHYEFIIGRQSMYNRMLSIFLYLLLHVI